MIQFYIIHSLGQIAPRLHKTTPSQAATHPDVSSAPLKDFDTVYVVVSALRQVPEGQQPPEPSTAPPSQHIRSAVPFGEDGEVEAAANVQGPRSTLQLSPAKPGSHVHVPASASHAPWLLQSASELHAKLLQGCSLGGV